MTYLIEGYWPPTAGRPDPERLARAAEASGNGTIHYLGAVTVAQDETVFWLFDAPSLEALQAAAAAAGMTVDRIVEATTQDLGGSDVVGSGLGDDALVQPDPVGSS
ncbi:MAG: hypothetical protein ABIR11_09680 [Candidatus Limnocylindrales bacterium]